MQVCVDRSMLFAPAGDCAPLTTSLIRPPSIRIVVAPSILPLAVSMRWPHCRAVRVGAGAGASAAAAAPARRIAATAAAMLIEVRLSIPEYGIHIPFYYSH